MTKEYIEQKLSDLHRTLRQLEYSETDLCLKLDLNKIHNLNFNEGSINNMLEHIRNECAEIRIKISDYEKELRYYND